MGLERGVGVSWRQPRINSVRLEEHDGDTAVDVEVDFADAPPGGFLMDHVVQQLTLRGGTSDGQSAARE